MNTYYLKKFRKAAKKHVKVEIQQDDEYCGKLVIAADENLSPLQIELIKMIPNVFLRKLYPLGVWIRRKKHYANRYGYFDLYEEEKNPTVLNTMTREQQIAAIKDARRIFIKELVFMQRSNNYRRAYDEKVKRKAQNVIAIMNELNRL